MSIFDKKRLDNNTFKLDIERMRKGWYTDKYFTNIKIMLEEMSKRQETFAGSSFRIPDRLKNNPIQNGDIEVEMQIFTRRPGSTIVVGVDKALAMLRLCCGTWKNDTFIETANHLKVWAVHDGCKVESDGNPLNVKPVIRIQGRYRDFAILETPMLGILTRASRVATNVYQTLIASKGKPVMFFPARFDLHEVQAADGYAYNISVKRFNFDFADQLGSFVSTDAQGDWWGGSGGGTVGHAAIASFMGDTSEAMLSFAKYLPADIPRIALVDFNNDCVKDSIQTCKVMFNHYMNRVESGDQEEAQRYILYGVRLDTSGSMRDVSVNPIGDPALDLGVNPRLVFNVRNALNHSWMDWDIPEIWKEQAKQYCQNIKIVVSGGFNPEKISRFEKLMVPADIYAVGSYLFDNHDATITDYTADVVRVKIGQEWVDMAKVGRKHLENEDLERVW
jgi:nicotinate phosphoribosyltransferase